MLMRCPECREALVLPEFQNGQGKLKVTCKCGKYQAEVDVKRGPALCQMAIDPGITAE